MIHKRNFFLLCWFLLCLAYAGNIKAAPAPVAEHVIKSGFPMEADMLAEMTQSLFKEYKANDNPLSLVFYAYGTLRQADYFLKTNDFIRASEFGKTGFFYRMRRSISMQRTRWCATCARESMRICLRLSDAVW